MVSSSSPWRASIAEEEAPPVVFPREGKGMNYALNWSLNRDGVTPSSDAFLNAPAEELKQKAGGAAKPKAAKGKARAAVAEAGTPGLSFLEFDSSLNEATGELSAATELYAMEGVDGGSGLGVRVITHDPAFALAASKIVKPSKVNVEDRPITVFVGGQAPSPQVQFEEGAAGGVEAASVVVPPAAGDAGLKQAIAQAAAGLKEEAASA